MVGGRIYFELSLAGTTSSSYITKGFLDELGYVEPAAKSSVDQTSLILAITIPLGIILLIVIACVISRKREEAKRKQIEKILKKKDS